MLTKVLGELMVFGLIALILKIAKEVVSFDPYSDYMMALQAADMLMFLMAIALILQSLLVFVVLRQKNLEVDQAELLGSDGLVQMAKNGPQRQVCCSPAHSCHSVNVEEMTRLRILRQFFLQRHGLPQLFPFSKYLRNAQDNLISNMLEVETSTWIILIGTAWLLEVVVVYVINDGEEDAEAIALGFGVFSWMLVLSHVVVHLYFRWVIDQLLVKAMSDDEEDYPKHLLRYLEKVARAESEELATEVASEAMAQMEGVREALDLSRMKRRKSVGARHDTGFQLLASAFQRLSCRHPPSENPAEHAFLDTDADFQLPWFSRKAWHVVVITLFMMNGFYCALCAQSVVHSLADLYEDWSPLLTVLTPAPLLLNMFIFHPMILRDYVVAACIYRVDHHALGESVERFAETVQLRSHFAEMVLDHIHQSGKTIDSLSDDLESHDPQETGFIDVEDARRVLQNYGFELSVFRFNSVVKVLFRLKGGMIEYDSILAILRMSDEEMTPDTSPYIGLGSPKRTGHPKLDKLSSINECVMLQSCSSFAPDDCLRQTANVPSPFMSGHSPCTSRSARKNHSIIHRANSSHVRALFLVGEGSDTSSMPRQESRR